MADALAGRPAAVGAGRSPVSGGERVVRVVAVVVAICAALVTGAVELLLTTLRAGDLLTVWRGEPIGSGSGPPLGLSIGLAVVGNLALAWFAVGTVGRRWALGPPWAAWTSLMLVAAGAHTAEGDHLLGGADWVALVMILAGNVAFAGYAYRHILQPPRS